MILGYNIKCRGMVSPVSVKGDSFDECIEKFRERYEYDYDYDTRDILSVESINFEFDII